MNFLVQNRIIMIMNVKINVSCILVDSWKIDQYLILITLFFNSKSILPEYCNSSRILFIGDDFWQVIFSWNFE